MQWKEEIYLQAQKPWVQTLASIFTFHNPVDLNSGSIRYIFLISAAAHAPKRKPQLTSSWIKMLSIYVPVISVNIWTDAKIAKLLIVLHVKLIQLQPELAQTHQTLNTMTAVMFLQRSLTKDHWYVHSLSLQSGSSATGYFLLSILRESSRYLGILFALIQHGVVQRTIAPHGSQTPPLTFNFYQKSNSLSSLPSY